LTNELRDVDAAITEDTTFLVGLGDLGLDGDDALEAGLEIIGHAGNLPGPGA
jgi:hypothetical protein